MLRQTHLFSLLLLVVGALPGARLNAQPPGPPRLSPHSTVSQVIGVSQVSITYGRPSIRERKIWDALVPYGEVWRTGANEATTVTFSDDMKIEGKDLAAGTYGLFTVPGAAEWQIIFNRNATQWGAFDYDPTQDALRVTVKPRQAAHQEIFQIDFPDVGIDTALIRLRWDSLAIPFAVQVDLRQAASRRAREFVTAAGEADGRTVWDWANYFYQNDYNTADALEWAAKLASTAPMYWTHALHARLLARRGDPGSAAAAASRALEKARDEESQPGVSADAQTLAIDRANWLALANE